MKQPSGSQRKVYLSNETHEQVDAKANEAGSSASSIMRESIEFTLNSPFIEWVNGKPVIKKDSE